MGSDITIVTGASSNHFQSLSQFLRSVPQGVRTIVYDLGLQQHEIRQLPSWVLYKLFDFSVYPSFAHITSPDAGAYAWKPNLIYDTCNTFGGIVVWCDAGNLITDLAEIVRVTKECKIYTATSSGTFRRWTHPTALRSLPGSERFLERDMRNAACVGVDTTDKIAQYFVYDWKTFALRQEISLPPGANRMNHRHDQSILTYLIYSYNLPYNDLKVGHTIHNDVD
jgi:hypothetical protein